MTDCYLASYSCIFRWGNELLFFLLMYVQILCICLGSWYVLGHASGMYVSVGIFVQFVVHSVHVPKSKDFRHLK